MLNKLLNLFRSDSHIVSNYQFSLSNDNKLKSKMCLVKDPEKNEMGNLKIYSTFLHLGKMVKIEAKSGKKFYIKQKDFDALILQNSVKIETNKQAEHKNLETTFDNNSSVQHLKDSIESDNLDNSKMNLLKDFIQSAKEKYLNPNTDDTKRSGILINVEFVSKYLKNPETQNVQAFDNFNEKGELHQGQSSNWPSAKKAIESLLPNVDPEILKENNSSKKLFL